MLLASFLAVLMGVSLGLFGGGGSIIAASILLYVIGQDPKEALATSSLVVCATSVSCMIQHARNGHVRFRPGLIFGLFTMAGAYPGGLLAKDLPGWVLVSLLGLMMIVSGVAMIQGRRGVEATKPSLAKAALHGLIVGAVTGVVSVGGGFLIVPALVLFSGLDMKSAVATSTLVVAMKSLAGFAGYATHVTIDYELATVFIACAVVGSLVGTALVARLDPTKLRKGFGAFVLVMAGYVLYQQVTPEVLESIVARGWPFGVGLGCLILIFFCAERILTPKVR
jgi:uncharacterized protein